MEDILRQHDQGPSYGKVSGTKTTVWATIQKYKTHGTISHLPGSGRPFKLTCEMLDAIEEQMKPDDGTTVTQLVKMLGEHGFKILTHKIKRARDVHLGSYLQQLLSRCEILSLL